MIHRQSPAVGQMNIKWVKRAGLMRSAELFNGHKMTLIFECGRVNKTWAPNGRDALTKIEGILMSQITRCPWATTELMIAYHDEEWGQPVHEDRKLFEFLILEGAQAGLSWNTILNRREGYRKAFHQFDPIKVAELKRSDLARLMKDVGIIRNRLKIESAVKNARAFLEIQREFGSFDSYIWQFVGGKPRVNRRRNMRDVPARTAESDAMCKDLKRRGCNFVGSTICYAFMQAVGMVDDHVVGCFRHKG